MTAGAWWRRAGASPSTATVRWSWSRSRRSWHAAGSRRARSPRSAWAPGPAASRACGSALPPRRRWPTAWRAHSSGSPPREALAPCGARTRMVARSSWSCMPAGARDHYVAVEGRDPVLRPPGGDLEAVLRGAEAVAVDLAAGLLGRGGGLPRTGRARGASRTRCSPSSTNGCARGAIDDVAPDWCRPTWRCRAASARRPQG